MDNRKTSSGFAKISLQILKYVVIVVIAVVFATTAFNFGSEIFSNQGREEEPGTDMTITVTKGTTMKQLGAELEEYQIINDSTIFAIQSYIYNVRKVKPGTYTFNTSQDGEEILKIVSEGPKKDSKTEKETTN